METNADRNYLAVTVTPLRSAGQVSVVCDEAVSYTGGNLRSSERRLLRKRRSQWRRL